MKKKISVLVCIVMCMYIAQVKGCCTAYGEEQSAGTKAKNFWQWLFGYPAKVTQDSAAIVADTGKKSVDVVANEVKTVGQVTSGEVEKMPELVTEPVKNTAEMTKTTVEDTVKMPIEAAKEAQE